MPVILRKNYSPTIADVEAEIFDRIRNDRIQSFIHVVPTKRKLRDAHRMYIRAAPGGIAPAIRLFTLDTLAGELYGFLGAPKRLLEGPAQAVLINEALQAVRSSLAYFRLRRGSRLPKGTFQKIVNVINTLKEQGVYLAEFQREVEGEETDEKFKLADILLLYEEYERRLGSRFTDPAGRLKEVNNYWFENASAATLKATTHFAGIDALFVSGFDEFSDPEITMIENFSTVPGIGTVISFDYHAGNEEVFGHLRENYKKFLELGFARTQTPAAASPIFAEHIAARLFRYDLDIKRLDSSSSIVLLAAADREKEVELIAKLIKQLARTRPDRDLGKICVATFQPQRYANLIREIFARYRIPVNVTDRYALDQSPFIVSLLSLLAVHQNDFRLTDLMRALASPYFTFGTMEGKRAIDAGNLHEVATRLKVMVGRATWDNRIDQRLTILEAERAEAEDESEEISIRREEEMFRRAKEDIARVGHTLSRFDGKMNAAEFRQHILDLLDELQTVRCLLLVPRDLVGDEQLEKDVRAYRQFLNFLDEFLGILALEQPADAKEALSYYTERMRAAIPQVRYNVRQKHGYGVQVTSFDETRGLSFETMIIAGLVDGEFPPVYQPEIFFSNARREKKERYHLTEHRYLFYQALTNFSEHLYLTVPRSDKETPLVPSSFIDALLRTIVLDDRRDAPPPELTLPLYSQDELLQHLGGLAGHADAEFADQEMAKYPHLRETLDHMRKAIAVEKSRIDRSEAMPEYNGRIHSRLSEGAREALGRFRHRVYSVTQLESYGSCPFQFFADRVLRLHVVPEATDGVSPLERGGVLHEVLFEFYTARRDRGQASLAGCSDAEFTGAVADLTARARAKLDALTAVDIFWDVEKELILGAKNRKGILEEFVERERESTLAVQPRYFEVAFGSKVGSKRKTDAHLTSEEPVTAGNVHLRGKIDRVDVGGGLLTIVDYKTGAKLAGRKEIDAGMSLQLPIYLYAVEQMLADQRDEPAEATAGVYYKLRSPVEAKLGIGSAEHRGAAFEAGTRSGNLVPSDDEMKATIARAIAYVNSYVDGIATGEFPVEPKDPVEVCRYCAFQTICRIKSRVLTLDDGDRTTEMERS